MPSDTDHTVLPANYTMPAFTPQPQSITAFGWYSFYRPTEGRMLSRPGWLVTFRNKVPPPGVEPGHVNHPSTNRARRRVTSLIRPTPLPLRHAVTHVLCRRKTYTFAISSCDELLWCSREDNFLPARRYMLARVLAVIVCRPSVRLSHAVIVSKQLNIRSCKQRHVIAQGLS